MPLRFVPVISATAWMPPSASTTSAAVFRFITQSVIHKCWTGNLYFPGFLTHGAGMEDEETRLRARMEVLEAALRQSISSGRGRSQLIEQLSAAHNAVWAQ